MEDPKGISTHVHGQNGSPIPAILLRQWLKVTADPIVGPPILDDNNCKVSLSRNFLDILFKSVFSKDLVEVLQNICSSMELLLQFGTITNLVVAGLFLFKAFVAAVRHAETSPAFERCDFATHTWPQRSA